MIDKKYVQKLIKATGNELATVAEDGVIYGDIAGYIDTGSYSLNALLCGSIYGGVASNKIVGFAGDPSTGKSFFSLGIGKYFLDSEPEGLVFCFVSESDYGEDVLESRGIDTSRFILVPVDTAENFRTQIVNVIEKLKETKQEERPKILFILDSLGNLSTNKELEDIKAGKNVVDMTRAKILKGAFRAITMKLGILQIPMIVVNHVYDNPTNPYMKNQGGGKGLLFVGSQLVILGKAQLKESGERTGTVITATLDKSRFTVEGLKVKIALRFSGGLDRYYGLLDITNEAGITEKDGTKIKFVDSGLSDFEVRIYKKPEKFFTKDVLDAIDAYTKANWLYSSLAAKASAEEEEDDDLSVEEYERKLADAVKSE